MTHFFIFSGRELLALGQWAYWILFFGAIVESVVFVGWVIPGSFGLGVIGFLVSQKLLLGPVVLPLVVLGGVVGDFLSFYIGWRGNRLLSETQFKRGDKFFQSYGNMGVFLGRFIGPLRPILALLAGFFKMSRRKFLFWDTLSAVLWVGFYFSLGYFFGHELHRLRFWSMRISVISILFLILFFLWFFRKETEAGPSPGANHDTPAGKTL